MGTVLRYGFKKDVEEYLKTVKVNGVTGIKDIVEFNKKDLENRAPYGQSLIEESLNDTKTTDEEFRTNS